MKLVSLLAHIKKHLEAHKDFHSNLYIITGPICYALLIGPPIRHNHSVYVVLETGSVISAKLSDCF